MEPEEMREIAELEQVLNDIGEAVTDDLSEDEVQMVFLNEGYFRMLGYERVGTDLRSEVGLPNGRADYITSGNGTAIRDAKTVVYEFKQPERSVTGHEEQLFRYMDDAGATFGVLTNGVQFDLYQETPVDPEKKIGFALADAGESEASALLLCLGYWSIQERNIKPVAEKTAKMAAESLPAELHLDFSEAGIELFAEHFFRYLKEEFSTKE